MEPAALPDSVLSLYRERRDPDRSDDSSAFRSKAPETSPCGRRALAGECEKIRSASFSERNNILNTASFKLGQLIESGELIEKEVWEALSEAAADVGLEPDEIAKTIESGLEAGKTNPRVALCEKRDSETCGKLASEIVPEPIDWLWEGHIARGKLHVIDGDPGQGRSALTANLV
jgi:hypothetical protein